MRLNNIKDIAPHIVFVADGRDLRYFSRMGLVGHSLLRFFRRPRQSVLIICIACFGAFGLFFFAAFTTGIMYDYKKKIVEGQLGNGQIFVKGYRESTLKNPQSLWIDDYESLRTKLKTLPEVSEVFPRMTFTSLLSHNGRNISAMGEAGLGEIEQNFFTAFRFVEGGPIGADTNGIVLGKILAESLGVKVGDTITLLSILDDGSFNAVDTHVKGIYKSLEKNLDSRFFKIHFKKGAELLQTSKAEKLLVGLKSLDGWPEFVQKAKPLLGDHYEFFSFEELDQVYYGNSVRFLHQQFQMMNLIFAIMMILAIFNSTSISLISQRTEMGVFRSFGWSKWKIAKLFSLQNLWAAVAGGVLGTLIMYFLHLSFLRKGVFMPPAPGFTDHYYAYLKLDWDAALYSILFSVACCFVAFAIAFLREWKLEIPVLLKSH